uniref:Uncharacterized protein n=1 Tax=Oryza barthii TaxID=65489 RepID=A0A0D3GRM7_9ORYZ
MEVVETEPPVRRHLLAVRRQLEQVFCLASTRFASFNDFNSDSDSAADKSKRAAPRRLRIPHNSFHPSSQQR